MMTTVNKNLAIIKEALTLAETYQAEMVAIFKAHYGTMENHHIKLFRRSYLELHGCANQQEVYELINLHNLHDRYYNKYQPVFEMYNEQIRRIKEAAYRL